ncbi:NAD-dependent epimerase/dehydratase family protein [Bailinhaonella thermotolerans]|uniref:NAD-dependent epimerase/dehydratase family protein n=1 Tax=Bailinhaonella thermotolerans TaxID=1070861 RepID=A0A3A4BFC4_9ACTN|nr:NAD-dependent epimerase/dehydratase family protein [Bailinhaonella thermotolerans]RJL33172.1 NAD-dependent epimerase/dehydratase family protein [Bailinhaonella thermotolerans]
MRVLVTGGSGFVGSHAVAAMLGAGHEPRLLVRDKAKAERVLAGLGVSGTPDLVPGDVRDAAGVKAALEGCDAVLHAAADMGVTGRAADLAGSNVAGTENVLGQAAGLGLDPVIHVSTVAVFVPPAGDTITVDSPPASPRNEYGRSKLAAERYARRLQDEGAPVTIVYPGGVVGPAQPTLDALMEGLRAGLTQGWPITRGGVGVVDVRDLAQVLARCLTSGEGPRRLLLGGHFLRWAELADLCDRISGARCRRFPVPARLLQAGGSALDALKRIRPFSYPLTRDAADMMISMVPTDDRPTLDALGVTLRPAGESLADAVRWLVAAGHLPPRHAPGLAS